MTSTTMARLARRKSDSLTTEIELLTQFIRIPSVSSQPSHARDVHRCAEWLADHLRRAGLSHVEVIPTPRLPIVHADWLGAPGAPTILIYGHYDVQPAEPLSAWRSPAFTPRLEGGYLYGRGASDDKGQLWCHVAAIGRLLHARRRLPVNVRCLFEGEEEIGSPNLRSFLHRHRGRLRSDVCVISDTQMAGPDQPAIIRSLRGGLGLEIQFHGPPRDLHSGAFGGAIHNPLQALCEFIAGLHDRNGRIAISGFYDSVASVGADERASMARVGPGDVEILKRAGVSRGWGEVGHSLHERTTVRPALTINGLTGGHQGPGGKAVIPATASAKLSFRLVPDQNPMDIARLFRAHLARCVPRSVTPTVRVTSSSFPARIRTDHWAFQAAADAYRAAFGVAPILQPSGGSIPIVSMLQRELGVPVVLMGFALPMDAAHGPNERFSVRRLERGIRTAMRFLHNAADAASLPSTVTPPLPHPP